VLKLHKTDNFLKILCKRKILGKKLYQFSGKRCDRGAIFLDAGSFKWILELTSIRKD